MSRDEARFRREAERETKEMRREARAFWAAERARHIKKSGPGFMRYTDKEALKHVAIAVDRSLRAGAQWADIERAIVVVAADPQKSPWSIFDQALVALADREKARHQEMKVGADMRVSRGLRPMSAAVIQRAATLRDDGEA